MVKSFRETAELDPCVDDPEDTEDPELDNMQWFYSDPNKKGTNLISLDVIFMFLKGRPGVKYIIFYLSINQVN